MISLPKTPKALSIYAFFFSLTYFILMIISPALPPALLFSALVAYFVYTLSGNYLKESFLNPASIGFTESIGLDTVDHCKHKEWVWGSKIKSNLEHLRNYQLSSDPTKI